MGHTDTMKWRKHGISLLIPTQNAEKTVEMSVRSIVDFADEIIAVDNGSTDSTIDIMMRLEREIDTLRFFNVPELTDLYQNRQYAFERSQFNWVVRFDSDYVAYTSGEYDIKNLRRTVLNRRRSLWPVSFAFPTVVSLINDFYHTGIPREDRPTGAGPHVTPVLTVANNRIYQSFPSMKFARLGRWEGVRGQKFLRKPLLECPPIFHCEIKSDPMDFFRRSERTNWRQVGDFRRYPALDDYLQFIIREKYHTDDIQAACTEYMDKEYLPYLIKYDPKAYYPYPEIIEEYLKSEKSDD